MIFFFNYLRFADNFKTKIKNKKSLLVLIKDPLILNKNSLKNKLGEKRELSGKFTLEKTPYLW